MRAVGPPVTYCRDVAPILRAYCQDCHRGGGIAPFPLFTYQDARTWAEYIQDDVQSRAMPPWPVDEDYGEFQQTRRLTDTQLATIAAWVNAGAPEGNPRELPPPRRFVDGWESGRPDLLLDPGVPYPLPPKERDVYRDFVLPFSPTRELWIAGLEVNPGAPSVVHHVSLSIQPSGKASASLPAIRLADWGPGTTPCFLPRGTAWKIPAHARLVMQVHYHAHQHEHGPPLPEAKPKEDRTRIGLYFARGPVDKRVRMGVIENRPKTVKPGPQATDEICACSFLYTVDAEHLTRSRPVEDDGIALINRG